MMSCLPATATGGIPRDQINTIYKGVPVDELGRSKEFKVLSCARPWSRAFHFSWLSFFVAFTGWFALVPAMEYIIDDTDNDVGLNQAKTSNIVSVLGTIFIRFALGPICEKYGARRPQAGLLLGGGALVLLSATISSSASLYALRFFIGLVGGAFVPCQYWTSLMYAKVRVGTANAFAGGWGNLGGGWALFFMGTLISAIRGSGIEESQAWRLAMIVPGAIMLIVALPMVFMSDDCPQGHWDNRLYNDPSRRKSDSDEKLVTKVESTSTSSKAIATDYRVWILAVIYAACFGVELAINNSISSYLYRYFNVDGLSDDGRVCDDLDTQSSDKYPSECASLDKDTASQIAAMFGLMNLFARALGGMVSDYAFHKWGMRGRLWTLFITLLGEGIMLFIFSSVTGVESAIVVLIFFSIFTQASEGATFAVVPFVNSSNIGTVAGIVGAGGNIGAVSWSSMFKAIVSQRDSYQILGGIVIASAALVVAVPIQGVYMLGCASESTIEDVPDNASETSEAAAMPASDDEVEENKGEANSGQVTVAV
jgi:NNP family nitrate/nitrite transporter-like MFS transporter